MSDPNGGRARLRAEDSHDLRDALAVTMGWLEILFRQWDRFPDAERREIAAAALLGAYRLNGLLDAMDGRVIDLRAPHERIAQEFQRLAD